MNTQDEAIVAVIRTLGFVGNMHYCPGCMNHFHDTCGQHEPDCPVLAEMMANEEWWDDLKVYLR